MPVDDPRLLTFAQGLNLPDLDAAGRQRAAGRNRGGQGMVLPAAQHVSQRHRVDGVGSDERAHVKDDPRTRRLRDVPEVGHDPVTDVDHGGGAGSGQLGAHRVRRVRTPVQRGQRAVPVTRLDEAHARRRTPQPAGDHDAVAGTRPRPRHRWPPLQIPERRDGQHHGVGGDDIPTDNRRPHSGGLVPQTGHEPVGHGQRQGRSSGETHEQRRAHRAHRRDVGEVLGGGLAPHLVGAGPVEAEMPPLHQQVCACDDRPAGRRDDRGIVTGPQEHQRGLRTQRPGDPVDKPELADIGNHAWIRMWGVLLTAVHAYSLRYRA